LLNEGRWQVEILRVSAGSKHEISRAVIYRSDCHYLCAAPNTSRGKVIPVKLAAPEYPPKVRTANIYGDINVAVTVRADGKIETAVESGHAMLGEAALDRVKESEFECRGCDSPMMYHLVYSFQPTRCGDCRNAIPTPVRVALSNDDKPQERTRIVITADELCFCDPAPQLKKNRSAKCLYLWRCS
jgi:TonB family protein